MEDTACNGKCPWVKSGFCEKIEECPNYVESWWIEGKEGQPKLIRDCSPKRLMIQLCNMQSRFEVVQAAAEEARNHVHHMKGHFMALEDATRNVLQEQEKLTVAMQTKLMLENKE